MNTADILSPLFEAQESAHLTTDDLADLLSAPSELVRDWKQGKNFPPLWIQNLVVEKIQRACL